MTFDEFSDWLAFDRLNPGGEERADVRAAVIATTVANANRSRRSRRLRLQDFLVPWDREFKAPRDWREIRDLFSIVFGKPNPPGSMPKKKADQCDEQSGSS